jgi:hypothetical protein
MFYEPI